MRPPVGATLLGGYRFDLRRKPAEDQFLQANLLPRIVDVDTHEIAVGVVIKLHALRNLACARPLLP